MNSINFINEKIKETEQSIRHWEMQLKNYPNEEVLTRCLNSREEELRAFQQIKTDLEAWRIIKNIAYYDPLRAYIDISLIYIDCPKNQGYQKLKKALEVN